MCRRCSPSGYNGSVLWTNYRAYVLVALAVFVFAFASFHPCLDAAGLCGLGGCPDASQPSHVSQVASPVVCLSAVLAAAGAAAPAFYPSLVLLRAVRQRRPAEAYLAPEPPPTRIPWALPSH